MKIEQEKLVAQILTDNRDLLQDMIEDEGTVKILNIQIPEKIAVIILKFEKEMCFSHRLRHPKYVDGMANSGAV